MEYTEYRGDNDTVYTAFSDSNVIKLNDLECFEVVDDICNKMGMTTAEDISTLKRKIETLSGALTTSIEHANLIGEQTSALNNKIETQSKMVSINLKITQAYIQRELELNSIEISKMEERMNAILGFRFWTGKKKRENILAEIENKYNEKKQKISADFKKKILEANKG